MIQIDTVHAKLLNGLVLASKPKRVLELGYGVGFATNEIYAALEYNQQPYTYTLVDNWMDHNNHQVDGPVQVKEKYSNKIDIVTANERDFVFGCKEKYDFIMSDADHHSTDQWFEYVYDTLLADDGILCYHDVMLTSMFPNLYRIVERCKDFNLRYKIFDKSSLPDEMCFRGLIVIFKP
jgi:predicted O-methyltransferase YrrM